MYQSGILLKESTKVDKAQYSLDTKDIDNVIYGMVVYKTIIRFSRTEPEFTTYKLVFKGHGRTNTYVERTDNLQQVSRTTYRGMSGHVFKRVD